MIETPRSSCPISRSIELLGDRWSVVILRDIALHDRRGFRELLTGNAEGISAPVLSRRLADLVRAGFLTKMEVERGRAGRYSLTEDGIQTVPLMFELGRLGAKLDPTTVPAVTVAGDRSRASIESYMDRLRSLHLN
ncbi:helix-turn-helix transcriptional regulator [Dietzia aerolata]|nr:helix-turn-helix transcriptional regulator [Dietzia aerolata]